MKTVAMFVVLSLPSLLHAADNKQIVAEVKAVGGKLETDASGAPVVIDLYDGNNPTKKKGGLNTTINDAWLAKLAGVTTVTSLSVANCDVHADGLLHVATLAALQSLNLTLTPTTDADLAPLAPLVELRTLSLASSKCTGEGFRNLKSLKKLSNLNMHFTPANDAGLAAVAGVGDLERLWVVHAKFTDAAGPSFAAHQHLRRLGIGSKEKDASGAIIGALKNLQLAELELFDNQADDEGVKHAAAIKSLKLLNVSYGPTVTDAALAAVAQLPTLEEFKLSGALVTDAGLQQLAAVKSLKKIVLGKMKGVTPDGIAQLQKSRPDLTIETQ